MGSLGDIISRYRVKHIVIGLPSDEWAKEQIERFAKTIAKVTDSAMSIELVDENYTSVQAGEAIGNYQKNVAEDTLAAMIILERWLSLNPKE